MGWKDYDFPPPSRPREAKGGIKAQSKRGVFGASWWGRRWIEVLESFHIGARLTRGRSYARRGQVLTLTVNPGRVTATVQGSRPKPYQVDITVKSLGASAWNQVAEALRKQALFAAKLIAGEMPAEIEQAFTGPGVSLFPAKYADLKTACSCPDWSNPCKHIAAVYYLLAEEFDRDPFLIFKLRGMEREELMALIGKISLTEEPAALREPGARKDNAPQPLPLDQSTFWGEHPAAEIGYGEVAIPELAAVLAKRLGNFPFWRGEEKFLATLETIYRTASPAGMKVFLGEQNTTKEPGAIAQVRRVPVDKGRPLDRGPGATAKGRR